MQIDRERIGQWLDEDIDFPTWKVAVGVLGAVGFYGCACILARAPGLQIAILCCIGLCGLGRLLSGRCGERRAASDEPHPHDGIWNRTAAEHRTVILEGLLHEASAEHDSSQSKAHDPYFLIFFLIVLAGCAVIYSA